ncbi:DUF6517 family protein [Halobacteria archaeon AArc-dxtr1]|nr:DUF6517 family protein [Halobacteria archaeon AArc-dxtr1]
MDISRRTYLAAGGVGALGLTAGCLDFVLGDGPLSFEAEQAVPGEAALSETDFAEFEITEETMEDSVSAAGIERDVEASYWISAYIKEVEIEGEAEDISAFAAVSTPDVSVAGQSFNPVAEMDTDELLDEYGGEINSDRDLSDAEYDRTETFSVLGEDRDVDVYVGEQEYEGETVTIDIYVTNFGHDDDYLAIIGVHPHADSLREAAEAIHLPDGIEGDEADEHLDSEIPDGLDEDIQTLFESVEHPA